MYEIKITTFNIRCFGFDGDYFARSLSESRIKYLRAFIQKKYDDTDVFVLQEIMDLSIINSILPDDFKFYYYEHDYERHMHVVLACKKQFDFVDIKTIPNTALDKTKSRPVIHGKLVEGNLELMHVFGLHLKSGFEHTDKRIFQCETIRDYIVSLGTDLPIVMAGDFNSHFKNRTKKEHDDVAFFKTIFENVLELAIHDKKTYVLPTENAHLDHIWYKGLELKSIHVYDLEKYTPGNSLKNYFNEISDHLPVQIAGVLKR